MNKKLIVCCDGLWREPSASQTIEKMAQQALISGDQASLIPNSISNVLKFTYALNPKHSPEHDGTNISSTLNNQQLIYYHPGNQSKGLIQRWLSNQLGAHTHQQILSVYEFLITNYRPGDKIYILGASQGAYSARSIAGLISTLGILKPEDLPYLDEAFQYYQTPIEQRGHGKFYHVHQLAQHAQEANRIPQIEFLGVWDCVGGNGAPLPIFNSASHWRHLGFHNTKLSSQVKNAYHALALDETQRGFTPDLWTDKHDGSHVKQVWFSGSHLDICGGGTQSGLADITLQWMIEQAEHHGLSFDHDYLSKICQPDLEKNITHSDSQFDKTLDRTGIHKIHIRQPKTTQFGLAHDQSAINETVHPSVQLRLAGKLVESPDVTEKQIVALPLSEATDSLTTNLNDYERRTKRRTPLQNETGLLHLNGKIHACLLLDITQGQGIRIQSALEIPKGSVITIDGTKIGPLHGKVVWHKGTQTGIELAA